MSKALIVGIDRYDSFSPLNGCVNDAESVANILATHDDKNPNFECRLITSDGSEKITRRHLRMQWLKLFSNYSGDILFYFAGHGASTPSGVVIATQDGIDGDVGLPMDELLTLANSCHEANSILLILDCCHSGALGTPALFTQPMSLPDVSLLSSGVTILAATRPHEPSIEVDGQGVFTQLLIDALKGAAADVQGNVSAASMYAYVEQSLGAWDQRPLYKTNASNLNPVRRCIAKITPDKLRMLANKDLFPTANYQHTLRPSYEYTREEATDEDVAKFDYFKLLRNAGLLDTHSEDLYFLAVGNPEVPTGSLPDRPGTVELTPLGRFYWQLAKKKRI